jgi:3-oxoadipate enol-lactonase
VDDFDMTQIPALQSASDIHSVRTGKRGAPLVVLVHAVGIDLTYWGDQIEMLRTAYDVVAYDLPGHGGSARPAKGFGFADAVATLTGVITDADAGPAHIVGLSVGGMIAQNFALARPDLVRSLVLVDTTSTFPDTVRTALLERARLTRAQGMGAILKQTLERWFTEDFIQRRPDVIDRVTRTLLADDPEIHAGMWEMIATLDTAPRLASLDRPTLMVVGEHDPSTPVAASRAMAERIPGAVLHIVPDASHLAPLEQPSLVNEILQGFLAAH